MGLPHVTSESRENRVETLRILEIDGEEDLCCSIMGSGDESSSKDSSFFSGRNPFMRSLSAPLSFGESAPEEKHHVFGWTW